MNYKRNFLNQNFSLDKSIYLDKASSHHLLKVLRKKEGDEVEFFDGQGKSCIALISKIHKSEMELKVISILEEDPRSGISIDLGQSLIKNDPFNWTLQKATELGVKFFSPLFSEGSVIRLKENSITNKMNKWNLIARGACEQCGENWLPIIEKPMDLKTWAEKSRSDTKIVLYPESEMKISDIDIGSSVSLAVGPEGDFTKMEIDSLTGIGFIPVTIGKRILRAETATVSALSVLRFAANEF